MKTTAEKIAIMQAFEDGNTVETADRDGNWYEIDIPLWNWQSKDYRIKQEPREWWTVNNLMFNSLAAAENYRAASRRACRYHNVEIKHVREVLE